MKHDLSVLEVKVTPSGFAQTRRLALSRTWRSRPQSCDSLLLWVKEWMILRLASVTTVLWMTRPRSPAHSAWEIARSLWSRALRCMECMAQALPRLPTQELCSTAVLRRQAAQCIPSADTAVLASMDLSVPQEWSEVPEVPGFTMLTFCIILH